MIPSLLTDSVTFDLERAIHYTLLWGLEGVELRRVGGAQNRVPYVNESVLRRRIEESELEIVAADPGMFEGDADGRAGWLNELAEFDEILQFCRRVGCPRVVVSSLRGGGGAAVAVAAGAIREAAARASDYGVTLCVRNEPGAVASDGRGLAALLDAAEGAAAAWDPAAAAQAGEDPREGLAAIGARVGLVRCRNGRPTAQDGSAEGNGWEPRTIDNGVVDWQDHLRQLRAQDFDGPISLEVTTEPHGRQGLHDATALIQYIRNVERERTRLEQ